jgi:polar amino acid transport system substrate-binding protein
MKKRMFTSMLIVLTLLCLSFAASAQMTVTLVSDPFPPYVTGKANATSPTGGVTVEILNKIFERIDNVRLELKLYPWKRALQYAFDGKVDGIWMVIKNKERMQFLDYTEPLLEMRAYLWFLNSRYPDGITWETLSDLVPYRIGVVRGYDYADALYEAQKQGIPLKIEAVTREEQNFLRLVNDRVDIIPAHEAIAYEQIKKHGWQDQLGYAAKLFDQTVVYIGISKKSPAKDLIPKINQAITELNADGTIEKILRGGSMIPR